MEKDLCTQLSSIKATSFDSLLWNMTWVSITFYFLTYFILQWLFSAICKALI